MPRIAIDIVDVVAFRREAEGVEFLLLRRAPHVRMPDTWQAVHGHIEPGETAAAAAMRELAEETGINPLATWQLERLNSFFVARDDCLQLCPGFAAEAPAGALVRLSAEHTEFRWVSASAAMQMFMWPGQRQAVREIMTEIVPGGPVADALRLT